MAFLADIVEVNVAVFAGAKDYRNMNRRLLNVIKIGIILIPINTLYRHRHRIIYVGISIKHKIFEVAYAAVDLYFGFTRDLQGNIICINIASVINGYLI